MSDHDRYQRISLIYDLFDLIFFLGGKGNPRKELPNVIENKYQNVLDICVGTASSSLLLASINDRIHVTGIDVSNKMLSAARKKISRKGIKSIILKRMAADDLKFESESFDAVMVSFALHEIESLKRKNILKEAARVTKQGGKLCIIDFSRQNDWRNKFFLGIWGTFEPKGFNEFLNIDWQTALKQVGWKFLDKKDFTFSSLFTFEKTN
jgi:ubiquinone/menaquinone biosynthesis C-methylase UbiE